MENIFLSRASYIHFLPCPQQFCLLSGLQMAMVVLLLPRLPYFLDKNAHSNTMRPRIQDYQGLLTNWIERALIYNAHLLITDDLYQCLWCCNSFLSKWIWHSVLNKIILFVVNQYSVIMQRNCPWLLVTSLHRVQQVLCREAERNRPRPRIERALEYNACQQLTWN